MPSILCRLVHVPRSAHGKHVMFAKRSYKIGTTPLRFDFEQCLNSKGDTSKCPR